MSQARISSALGVLPSLWVGVCATAVPQSGSAKTIPVTRTLRKLRIVHAPVTGHPPGLNGIPVIDPSFCGFEKVRVDTPLFADVRDGRLDVALFIRAAGLEHSLLSIPIP